MTNRPSVLEELFNRGDAGEVHRFAELLHDGVIVHAPFGLSTTGMAAEQESWRRARAAMPDLHHAFEVVVREGAFEAARCVVTGTLMGEYGGLRAEAAPFRIDQALFARLEDGKIAELWEIVDTESLLTQLGSGDRR
jgi:predicted ester cyclase